MSLTETGMASKLQAANNFITYLKSQSSYTPPSPDLTVSHLEEVLKTASESHEKVSVIQAECAMARGQRNIVMKPLSKTALAVKDLMASIDIVEEVYQSIKALCDKITGSRRLSQQGTEARVDHFSQMIDVLKGLDNYAPAREELQISQLESFLQQMKDGINNVYTCENKLKHAQTIQKEAFNGDNGLYGITRRIKLYLKSLFGARSAQYKEVVRITRVITK
ncbi:hypothetical protein [Carboxylicivirga linearis]|uniref:Uncharacterized protein n=1 Tax=Carboxylicivirga linearis TaxID=1628157 RepID=A0ABS5JRI9_9BACT|nr:hypothetical protein [Carboxylicivirga linearis]MBS2097455.1 hypothetical protein [Carboxylicivirga linearis]